MPRFVLLPALLVLILARFAAANDPIPRLQTISPVRGPVVGGTIVELHGEHFGLLPAAGVGVAFGGSPGADVHVVSDTLITAVSPLHSPGSIFVRITVDYVPIGSYGRRVFVFDEDLPSATTTTTTSPGGSSTSSTSTTLPCSACADGDACTVDLCVPGGCDHRQARSLAELVQEADGCRWQFVPVRIGERFLLGCGLVAQGGAAPDAVIARRLLKAGISVYTRALRASRQAGQALDSGVNHTCAVALENLLETARQQARVALGQQ